MFESLAFIGPLIAQAEDTSLNFSWIDAIFILFFVYGFASAHRLGIWGELPRAAGWIASLILGVRWYPYVASQFEANAGTGAEISPFYGFLLIGIFFLSVAYVIGMTISRLRKKAVEGGFDLWGAMLLGPAKMVAAYFCIFILLLLFPSVWFRNNVGLKTYTGTLLMKYVPDLKERIEGSKGQKDSFDRLIEKKRRRSVEEEIQQMDETPSSNSESTE